MKVLIISPTYWPAFSFGGPIQSLHLLCRHLKKAGNDITVYTTDKGQGPEIMPNTRHLVDDVSVIYFSSSKYIDILNSSGWNFSIPFVHALKKNLKNFDVVYILSVWNFTTAATAYYCRKYGIPYILSPRGQLYDYVLNSKSWKKIPYYKLISSRDINYAAAVHYTTSDEYENVHIRLGLKSRHFIVPNGIDLSEYATLPKKGNFIKEYSHLKDKKIIIFLGRLDPKKGIDILIKSFL